MQIFDGGFRFCVRVALGLLVCASIPCSTQTGAHLTNSTLSADAVGDSAEVQIRHRVEDYARSIDNADTELASKVWLNSPDVSFIHPLGHEHGFEQIKQNVYERLMGETFSERRLSPRDVSVHVYGDSAWVEFYWDFNAKFKKDGSPITTHGRETQVYWKTQDGWRLVHVHYSGMPQQRSGP